MKPERHRSRSSRALDGRKPRSGAGPTAHRGGRPCAEPALPTPHRPMGRPRFEGTNAPDPARAIASTTRLRAGTEKCEETACMGRPAGQDQRGCASKPGRRRRAEEVRRPGTALRERVHSMRNDRRQRGDGAHDADDVRVHRRSRDCHRTRRCAHHDRASRACLRGVGEARPRLRLRPPRRPRTSPRALDRAHLQCGRITRRSRRALPPRGRSSGTRRRSRSAPEARDDPFDVGVRDDELGHAMAVATTQGVPARSSTHW